VSAGSELLVDEATVEGLRSDCPHVPFRSNLHDRSEYYIQNYN
jgi:hypothetical protein